MNENANLLKGRDKISHNDFDGAIECFTKAIEEEPDNPFAYNERAVAYLNIGKLDLSMFDMNKSIELDENYAYFFSCRGFLKARMKDAEGAVADYERSLELDPENEITYNNLGLVLEQMGAMKRAQKMFKRGNEILGYDPDKRSKEEVENTETKEKTFGEGKSEVKKEQPETELPPKKNTKKEKQKLAKEVFSNKSTFKEFLGFIGRGFKLEDQKTKKDDKEGKS